MKKYLKLILLLFLAINAKGQNINLNSKELYPEGLAYNKKEKVFYVSSLRFGRIGKVNRNGEYTSFIEDKELISTIGIHLNSKQNLLYVCVSDPGVSVNTNPTTQMKLAKVIAYNTKTGKRKFIADLGALNPNSKNFANDLDFDKSGNAYVTNSASPIIYKITPEGNASIFTSSDDWNKEGFNLNGIVFHPNNYLLTVQSNTGELFKISVKNPQQIARVNSDLFPGGDGLILNGKNELIVISNSKKQVYKISSTNDFGTAKTIKTVASEMDFPTTGVYFKGMYYVINAKLNEIFNPSAAKTSNFLIQAIKF